MVTSGGLNRILKDWDSANGDQRKHLLVEFCDLTRNKTALDMQGSVHPSREIKIRCNYFQLGTESGGDK